VKANIEPRILAEAFSTPHVIVLEPGLTFTGRPYDGELLQSAFGKTLHISAQFAFVIERHKRHARHQASEIADKSSISPCATSANFARALSRRVCKQASNV
jgi:Tat protein secretion system quality control protein TatD with DNase activity